MKSEFVYVKPKTAEAYEYFEHDMHFLHSCKVKDKRDGKLFLSSISGTGGSGIVIIAYPS